MKNKLLKILDEDCYNVSSTNFENTADRILDLFDVSDGYQIIINSTPNFRKELIKMVEQVRLDIGEYSKGSSTEIAERFEQSINYL